MDAVEDEAPGLPVEGVDRHSHNLSPELLGGRNVGDEYFEDDPGITDPPAPCSGTDQSCLSKGTVGWQDDN